MTDEPLTAADADSQVPVPLLDELRIEASLVPHRRGRLYALAADEIEALRKDAEKARRDAREWRKNFTALQHALVGETGASGIETAHALRKDAARYRWLREKSNTGVNIDIGAGFEISDTLDAAIDAAMEKP